MSGTEFQKQFLARLLLVSAQAAGSHQGSTSCTSSDVHMTLPIDLMGGREPRRRSRASYIVDSGASLHCINDINLFDSIYQDHRPVKLRVANGKILVSHAVGSVKINLQRQDGTTHSILIHNVVYHPEFSHNLLSVRRLWKDNGLKARFGDKNYFKCKNTNEKFSFAFDREFKVQSVSAITTTQIGADLLHSRLGHCGKNRLRLCPQRSANFPSHSSLHHDPSDCDACQAGATRRRPFPRRTNQKFTMFGQRLSSDLCGPFPPSVTGKTYALCIVDAATNVLFVEYLDSKSSTLVRDAFQKFMRVYSSELQACRDAGFPVTWHTDHGGEFMSSDLDDFCEEFAVKRSFSVPYAPPLNAHAERMWGILLRTIRTTMAESGLPTKFWTYAMDNAVTLHNSLPSMKHSNFKSPTEVLTGNLPDLGKFRVFGCVAWFFLPEHERSSKIGPRSVPAVNLGCDPERNGYLLYVPSLNRITSAYHVSFQERKFLTFSNKYVNVPPSPSPISPPPPANHPDGGSPVDIFDDAGDADGEDSETVQRRPEQDQQDQQDRCTRAGCTLPRGHDGVHSYEDVGTWKEGARRKRQQAQLLAEKAYDGSYFRVIMDESSGHSFIVSSDVHLDNISIPDTFEQSQTSRFKDRWLEAMLKEITDLMTNKTWTLVDRSDVPDGRRITKSRWCYDLKYLRDGTIERFKARFVACGYSQIYGQDYTHSFSATLRATSFRTFLAVCSGRQLKIDQFDITNAFTEADIDTEIYVEPPKGFTTKGKDGQTQVLRLRKALYGTKQASRLYQKLLVKRLLDIGFKQSSHDPCVFRYVGEHGECLVAAYVDDLLVGTSSACTFKWFSSNFIRSDSNPNGFRAKHLGKVNYFLGMAIDQFDDFSISVNQTKYIEKMLKKFTPSSDVNSIKHNKPCSPESFSKLTFPVDDLERERVANLPYLQVVGSLLYIACMTRPDIAYHVSMLSKFMHDPSQGCFDAAITLLLYLGNTKDMVGLHYSGSTMAPIGYGKREVDASTVQSYIENNYGFVAYSDASWRSKVNPYSSYGYALYLFGGLVSFSSKHLKIVALSSAEAEYAAAAQTAREMTFVRNLCADLGLLLKGRLCLTVDNEAAIAICENPGVTARNKHFSDQVHYVRHEYDHGRLRLVYVSTDLQRADGFTKPLDPAKFFHWRNFIIVPSHPRV